MKAKITQKLIDGLQPQPKPYEVHDTELRGFLLRVQPSGVKTYICQYARGKRITLGASDVMVPFRARELAKEAMAQYITTGVDPMETRKIEKTYTLESFIAEKYKPWVESNHRNPKGTLSLLSSWHPVIGDVKLADIKAWSIEKQRLAWLKAGAKPTTVNHKISYLKVALTTREDAQKEKRKSFNQWRKERGYQLFPDYGSGEFVDHLKPLVLLALNTGMRRGELFNLKWTDIDFARRMMTVQGQTAKSGKTRHIPMTNEAFDILTRWRAQSAGTGLVFPSADGGVMDTIKTSWLHLMKDSQIKNFRFHDCRHTFASRLVMKGVDLNTVRELLGHGSIEMTLRYAHLAPAKLAAAIAVLDGQ